MEPARPSREENCAICSKTRGAARAAASRRTNSPRCGERLTLASERSDPALNVTSRLWQTMAAIAAVAFVIWAVATVPRPSYSEPAGPHSYPRGSFTLEPGKSFVTPLDVDGGAWNGFEFRLGPEAAGPVDFRVTDAQGSEVASGRLIMDGLSSAFVPVSVKPTDTGLRLQLSRPADAGTPVTLLTQHRGGEPEATYLWYRDWSWRGLAGAVASALPSHLLLLVMTLIWLLAPGYLLWRALDRPLAGRHVVDAVAVLPVVAGLSVSGLLFAGALWSFQPLRLSRETATGALIVLGVILAGAAMFVANRGRNSRATMRALQCAFSSGRLIRGGELALLIVIAAVIATRAAVLVNIGGAPGVDGTAIANYARVIQERGAFLDVSPAAVAERADFYHLGLSGLIALVAGTSGSALDTTMLLLGQAMQAVAMLGIVSLARQWRGGAWAGAFGLVFAGFVMPLPGFLVAWSRFTQISGLALLPPLFVFTTIALTSKRPMLPAIGAALLGAGIALTHYRALAFALAALPALVVLAPAGRCIRWKNLGVLAAAGMTVVVLLLPWIIPVAATFWLPAAAAEPNGTQEFPLWTLQSNGSDWMLIGLGIAAAGLLPLVRRWAYVKTLLPVAWFALVLAAFTYSGVVGFRLGLAVNPLSAAIVYYLPAGLLACWVAAGFQSLRLSPVPLGAALTIASIGIVAMLSDHPSALTARLPDLLIMSDADRAAFQWIERELPGNASFATNGTLWAYNLYIGTDGGYWLTNDTGHKTLTPPLNYAYRPAEETKIRTEMVHESMDHANDPAYLLNLWKQQGWTYLYLGRRGGPLDPDDWRGRSDVTLLYDQGGVQIYALSAGR